MTRPEIDAALAAGRLTPAEHALCVTMLEVGDALHEMAVAERQRQAELVAKVRGEFASGVRRRPVLSELDAGLRSR